MLGFVWGFFMVIKYFYHIYDNKLFLALMCLQQCCPVTEHPLKTQALGDGMQLPSWSHEGSRCKLQVCKVHSLWESNFVMSAKSNCWQLHAAGDVALAEACL